MATKSNCNLYFVEFRLIVFYSVQNSMFHRTKLSVTLCHCVVQVKENLLSCKMLLHCKRDELRKLWIEGIEHKHVLQLLDEIESIKQVPQRLETYMASKHYLHATDMLVRRREHFQYYLSLFLPEKSKILLC